MLPATRFAIFASLLMFLMFNSCEDEPVETDPDTFDITVVIEHKFGDAALQYDNTYYQNAAGNEMLFQTLKYLISEIKLAQNGQTIPIDDGYAYINPKEGKTSFVIPNVNRGMYSGLSLSIGVDSTANLGNPNAWQAGHPLNPLVNQMHWDWEGGYIFLAMDGKYKTVNNTESGFVYHVAFLKNKMPFSFDQDFDLDRNKTINLEMNVLRAFEEPSLFDINEMGSFSHSSDDDNGIAETIRNNMGNAIVLTSVE